MYRFEVPLFALIQTNSRLVSWGYKYIFRPNFETQKSIQAVTDYYQQNVFNKIN